MKLDLNFKKIKEEYERILNNNMTLIEYQRVKIENCTNKDLTQLKIYQKVWRELLKIDIPVIKSLANEFEVKDAEISSHINQLKNQPINNLELSQIMNSKETPPLASLKDMFNNIIRELIKHKNFLTSEEFEIRLETLSSLS